MESYTMVIDWCHTNMLHEYDLLVTNRMLTGFPYQIAIDLQYQNQFEMTDRKFYFNFVDKEDSILFMLTWE